MNATIHRNTMPMSPSEAMNDTTNYLIIDTGGGKLATITQRAWHITATHSACSLISGYQDHGEPKQCKIVNGITKVHIKDRDIPILFQMNYATLIDDPEESESLCVPFALMRHGIQLDMTPTKFGGEGGMRIEEQFFPFLFDDEKLYYNISRPTPEDLAVLEIFELTSPLPTSHPRRLRKRTVPGNIPITEWQKRLALAPIDIVHHTFDATTQHYMNLDCESRSVPRDHYVSRTPGLRFPRQNEDVATDTFFPSVTSSRGNTCSQFFTGLKSNRWEVFPLKTEAQNGTALQDYTRKVGVPNKIKSDNAQSETGTTWTDHCRAQCITTETTEPHHPWQNPSEPQIGALNMMVKRTMQAFNVPLVDHDWCQKWCCDVHNILASRKLNWRTPLEVNEGHTPDISKFRFHFYEPIWYHVPGIKAPTSSLQKGRWLGIAASTGDAMTYYIRTEKDPGEGRNVVLIRSVIKTRRKNIGTPQEYINNDPQYAEFFLSDSHDLPDDSIPFDDTTVDHPPSLRHSQ